jgi:hypothetical protein
VIILIVQQRNLTMIILIAFDPGHFGQIRIRGSVVPIFFASLISVRSTLRKGKDLDPEPDLDPFP